MRIMPSVLTYTIGFSCLVSCDEVIDAQDMNQTRLLLNFTATEQDYDS